jgi:hypothetical protein
MMHHQSFFTNNPHPPHTLGKRRKKQQSPIHSSIVPAPTPTHTHKTGPLAPTVWESNIRPCRKIWWAHFLYINDIYPWCVLEY